LAYQEPKIPSGLDKKSLNRLRKSISLVKNLRNLFSNLILSHQKYVDPKEVLSSIVDDFGNQVLVGEQKDITEYNLIFLERIQEGLGEKVVGNGEEIKVEEGSPLLPAESESDASLRRSSTFEESKGEGAIESPRDPLFS